MPLLYFPEDKTEYIPAAITCLLFIIGAFLTWRIFIKASKRELQKIEELEQRVQEMNHTAPQKTELP